MHCGWLSLLTDDRGLFANANAPMVATILLAVATKNAVSAPVSFSVPDDAIMTAEAQPPA